MSKKRRIRLLTNRNFEDTDYFEAIEIDEDRKIHFIAKDKDGTFDWLFTRLETRLYFNDIRRDFKQPESPEEPYKYYHPPESNGGLYFRDSLTPQQKLKRILMSKHKSKFTHYGIKKKTIGNNMNETAKILPFVRPDTDEGLPDDLCWLKRLGVGVIFLCQRKNSGSDFSVGSFAVASITEEKKIYGLVELQTNKPLLVNPVRFCNVFEQVEVLRNREEYLAEKELNDKRSWPDQSTRLDDDEVLKEVGLSDDESRSRNL